MINRKLIIDSLRTGERLGHWDANSTMVFTRELEHIFATQYQTEYPDYKARQLMAVNSECSPADEKHTFRIFDRAGEAKILSNFNANDFPNVEVSGVEVSGNIVSIGNKFGYTIQEMRASAQLGRSLPQARASAAREAMEQKLDRLACIGDASDATLKGLAKIGNDAAGSTYGAAVTMRPLLAAGRTVAEIVADVNAWHMKLSNDSKGVVNADTLTIPLASYNFLAHTPVALAYGSAMNIAQYILAQTPIKTIDFWSQLDTADAANTGPRCLMWQKSDDAAQLIIPQDFEQFAPQLEGLRFDALCHMRFGGVKSVRPYRIGWSDTWGDSA